MKLPPAVTSLRSNDPLNPQSSRSDQGHAPGDDGAIGRGLDRARSAELLSAVTYVVQAAFLGVGRDTATVVCHHQAQHVSGDDRNLDGRGVSVTRSVGKRLAQAGEQMGGRLVVNDGSDRALKIERRAELQRGGSAIHQPRQFGLY